MKTEWLLKSFAMIGEDFAQIEQLRQIAVALALTGRLSDANTEMSPQEMLEEIDRFKTDLLKRGAISKPKKLARVVTEQLPRGFRDLDRFAPLGHLARVEKGSTGIKKAKPGPFPLVVTSAERATCDHFDLDCAAAIIPLVSSTGHGHASLKRLHYQEGKFALGTILAAVIPYHPELISARFLFEYLSAFKEELLVTRMTGTANVTLTIGRITEVPVPLVDPVVQQKVDELMTLLDRLEAARNTRETARQKLLDALLHEALTPTTSPELTR